MCVCVFVVGVSRKLDADESEHLQNANDELVCAIVCYTVGQIVQQNSLADDNDDNGCVVIMVSLNYRPPHWRYAKRLWNSHEFST